MKRYSHVGVLLFVALFVLLSVDILHADKEDRLYDFTDAYYLMNGVDPAKIAGRRTGSDGISVFDTPFFNFQRNVRTTFTLPAYKHNGDLEFWAVMGDLFVDGFTKNAAGRKAKEIAHRAILYVFPTRNGDPIGLGNNRQADIMDMRNGYFSGNPLGLWLHIWISYTDKAFNTTNGKKMLADLEKRNGLALDGTPIIKTLSELENLLQKGYAQKRLRNVNGSEGPMYGICPVNEDPTDGGIAPDQFLIVVTRPDGSPVEPAFVINFNSLQKTGDWD